MKFEGEGDRMTRKQLRRTHCDLTKEMELQYIVMYIC